jgi:CO dehydrogenase maturation factor
MAYIIATAGKGGTGKTTIAAFLINYLRAKNAGSVLAIDADPNSNLNQALGVELNGTVVGILDKVAAIKDNGLPSGMTKDRFIEYEVQNVISESKGFDLLAMGRPEGPGCYCYANTVLRGIIERLTGAYDFVVIDNEAGMEHLSRRINRSIDAFFIISDFSRVGVRSAKRISGLAKEMEIKIGGEYLIVNMARGDLAPLKNEIDKTGLNLAGVVPFDESIEDMNLRGEPIMGHPEAQRAEGSLNRFFASLRMTIKGKEKYAS